MNEVIVGFSLLGILIFGYALLLLGKFLPDYNFLEKSPYSFGLGTAAVAFQLFTYSQAGIGWNYTSILLPWIILSIYLSVSKKKQIASNFKMSIAVRFSALQKFLLLLIAGNFAYTLFEAWLRPLYAWDGWAIWLIKSKMFFIDGFVNPDVYAILHDSYPFVINLSGTFIYMILGKVDDRAVLLLFYCFYLFLGIAFYNFLKKKFITTSALLFTFLLLSTQNILRHGGRFEAGYADLALGFYIFLSFTLLDRFIKSRKFRDVILCSLFLGATSLIKEEGLVASTVMEGILLYHCFFKNRNIKLLIASFVGFIPLVNWNLFKFTNQINYSLYEKSVIHIQRIYGILYEIGREFVNIQNWNLLWPAFFFALILLLLGKFKRNRLFPVALVIVFLQFLSYVFVFMISPHEPASHVRGVINRLLLHIAPIAIYIIGYAFQNKNYEK